MVIKKRQDAVTTMASEIDEVRDDRDDGSGFDVVTKPVSVIEPQEARPGEEDEEDPRDDVRNYSGATKFEMNNRADEFSFEKNMNDIDYENIQLGLQGRLCVPQSLLDMHPDVHFCWKNAPPNSNGLFAAEQQGYTKVMQHGKPVCESAGRAADSGFTYLMGIPLVVYNKHLAALHEHNRKRMAMVFKPNETKGQHVHNFRTDEIAEESLSDMEINAALATL